MMYLYLLKKEKGDVAPSPVVVGLVGYTGEYHDCFDILWICPGYMSTKEETIGKICDMFNMIAPKKQIVLCSGMNGSGTLHTGQTILKQHSDLMFSCLPIKLSGKDHSKAMFFLKGTNGIFEMQRNENTMGYMTLSDARDGCSGCNEIAAHIKQDLIDEKIYVSAALIGSSNVSYQTYLGNPADKGECDLLIVESFSDMKVPKKPQEQNEDEIAIRFYNTLEHFESVHSDYILNRTEKETIKIALYKEMKAGFSLNDLFLDYLNSQFKS